MIFHPKEITLKNGRSIEPIVDRDFMREKGENTFALVLDWQMLKDRGVNSMDDIQKIDVCIVYELFHRVFVLEIPQDTNWDHWRCEYEFVFSQ